MKKKLVNRKYPRYYDRGEKHEARIYRVTEKHALPEYWNIGMWHGSVEYFLYKEPLLRKDANQITAKRAVALGVKLL